jgi:hypothetical protein
MREESIVVVCARKSKGSQVLRKGELTACPFVEAFPGRTCCDAVLGRIAASAAAALQGVAGE